MTQLPYDITSAESIFQFSKTLTGKSLEEAVGKYNLDHASNKGKLGMMVEDHFFQYSPGPNKNHDPDFTEAGVELKVTGVTKKKVYTAEESPYRAKERLVLTMISYFGLADEDWITSSFLKKCSLMLILFYLYDRALPSTQRKFIMGPVLWEFPEEDLIIIKKDWLKIRQKVLDGSAHTLSEGDTFYLSACRKGSGGPNERLNQQPFSSVLAKSRAFSLKPSYVNTIINSGWGAESLITNNVEASLGIEDMAIRKFTGLEGKTVEEIAQIFNFTIDEKPAKNYLSSLSLRILGTAKKQLPEFEKSEVVLRTLRLQKTGVPKEAVSFPAFKFIELPEQQWEDSIFYEKINKKIFFVIYQYDREKVLRFKKVEFWNMPYVDRVEAKKVWQRTVDTIILGDMENLPKSTESTVAHVRPHARNKADTLPLPGGGYFTRQGFWLNQKYIAEQIK